MYKIFSFIALAAFVSGFIGYWSVEDNPVFFIQLLNVLYKTVLLFMLESANNEVGMSIYHPLLFFAKFAAPIALAGAIATAVIDFLSHHTRAIKRILYKNHTIVCGFDNKGISFIGIEKTKTKKIVIDNKDVEALKRKSRHAGVDLIISDARELSTLRSARVEKAKDIIICCGNDQTNLEVLNKCVVALSGYKNTHNIYVSIEDYLLNREYIAGGKVQALGREGISVIPFNTYALIADVFLQRSHLYLLADIRGQSRVTMVFLGFNQQALWLLAKAVPQLFYKDFDKPRCVILSQSPDQDHQKLHFLFPDIDSICDVKFMGLQDDGDFLMLEPLAEINDVTGYFLFPQDTSSTSRYLLSLQQSMMHYRLCQAPTWFGKIQGYDSILMHDTKNLVGNVWPLPGIDEVCKLSYIDNTADTLARKVHLAYLDSRKMNADIGESLEKDDSYKPWESLAEPYRDSSRRLANSVFSRLASAGNIVEASTLDCYNHFKLFENETQLEYLAGLEHISWMAGKVFDGWSYAKHRDNAYKKHNCLVDYEALSDAIKEYDRQQIRSIDAYLLTRSTPHDRTLKHKSTLSPQLIQKDIWLGIDGDMNIRANDEDWLIETLEQNIVPRLQALYPDAFFTLVTALKPGADYLITTGLHKLLNQAHIPHRVLVVEAVPRRWMLEDFTNIWRQGSTGGFDIAELTDWSDTCSEILSQSDSFIESSACQWNIDISSTDTDYTKKTNRTKGYRQISAYLAGRCHTLIAGISSVSRNKSATGTQETLSWHSARTKIPAQYHPLAGQGQYSKLFAVQTQAMVLDTKKQQVRHQDNKSG